MHSLVSNDWLIFLCSLFVVFAVGATLRSTVKTATDFFLAGRNLPTSIATLAFASSGLGALELVAMSAAGARYGFGAALAFSLAAVPALLFLGLRVMPVYYGSGARTAPGYLGLRFDGRTQKLAAALQILAAIVGSGAALWIMARIFQALHIFDPFFFGFGWPRGAIFSFCVVLFAAIVLIYVLLAGLRSTMANQALQFALLVAAFLPLVCAGLGQIGGWSGLKASAGASFSSASGPGRAGSIALCAAMGLLFGAGYWLTDVRALQTAMAAKDRKIARRIPIYAAAVRLAVPFLLVLPGAIAIGLPTPQNETVVRNENGAIYHEITVVPYTLAEGRGLVPARIDPKTNAVEKNTAGQTRLDYGMVAPTLLLRIAPDGLLGLGIAALAACLMSGVAASITAASAIFVNDLCPAAISDEAADRRAIRLGRLATLGAVLAAVVAAYAMAAASGANDAIPDPLAIVLAVVAIVSLPLLATYLAGMFSRRATAHGAFVGLIAGVTAAALHQALTLPPDASAGLHGGWFGIVHRYGDTVTQCTATALIGFGVSAAVILALSLSGQPRAEAELKGLVYAPLAKREEKNRPEVLAALILAAAVVLALLFS